MKIKNIVFLLCLCFVFSCAFCTPSLAGTDTTLYGDVNRDGNIDASDALLALQASVDKCVLNYAQIALADVNADSTIAASDALGILQRSVQKIQTFDAGDVNSTVYNIPDTAIDNCAYYDDTSADCSFIMDNTGLAENTIYTFSGVGNLTGFDGKDCLRLLYSLQGLINRDFGRDKKHTTLLYVMKDSSDGYWANYTYKNNDATMHGLKSVVLRTWDVFLTTFENQIKQCGIVLWDGEVPATANVAATICGVDGYLPVLVNSSLEQSLTDLGVQIKMSLVNMFYDGDETITGTSLPSSGSAKNDAYRWALEKYFDRCSANYLAYTLDGAVCYEDNVFSRSLNARLNALENHDYFIARRIFAFDLYFYALEEPCDDPAQIVGTDYETICMILARRFSRAKGAFGQFLGFPPWWVKYSIEATMPDTGEPCNSKNATWIEWLCTEVISCYNLAKEADAAGTVSMTNGSFFYKYTTKNTSFENNDPKEMLEYDDDIKYFTIYLGDYDSSAWMKDCVYQFWMKTDPARGTLPLMWAFNPNLSNRIPMAFDYVYQKKTDNDYFVAGDSGAGYVIPAALTQDEYLSYLGDYRPIENGEGAQVWADYCKKYYELFDLDITGFIINGSNALSDQTLEAYNQISPAGSFHNDASYPLTVYKGVAYLRCHNGIQDKPETPEVMYNHLIDYAGSLNFSVYRTVCSSPTSIKNIVNNYTAYAAEKGVTVQYVDPYNFFNLIRLSGQGYKLD